MYDCFKSKVALKEKFFLKKCENLRMETTK